MAVNVRAPALLIGPLRAAPCGRRCADRQSARCRSWRRPIPISSATPSRRRRWRSFTELAARALAPSGIRVNGIAPALMLRSSGQSEENFQAMHRHNPLGRGVEPERCRRGDPLSGRGALRHRPDAGDRFRPALPRPRRATFSSWVTNDAKSETQPASCPTTSRSAQPGSCSNSLAVETDIGFHEFRGRRAAAPAGHGRDLARRCRAAAGRRSGPGLELRFPACRGRRARRGAALQSPGDPRACGVRADRRFSRSPAFADSHVEARRLSGCGRRRG